MMLVRGDWFYVLLVLIDGFFMTRPYLYAIQQDNYRVGEIFKSKRLRFVYLIDLCTVAVFAAIWTLFYFLQARAFWGFVTALFFFITEFAMYFMEDLPSRKKPLRYTKRAVRCLIFVSLAATAVVTIGIAVANVHLNEVYLRYLVFFAYPICFPLIFIVATSVLNVFERINNARYERACARTLAKQDGLIKIAITGSYGKTSVKNYLHAMLSEKYNVLTTPASFNTPMGIAKSVKGLDGTQDVFIAEFGARRVGDIKKLMKIVSPQYTILTGINSQHLETFKTQDNIKREKCRILHVPHDGFCVVNRNLRSVAEDYMRAKRMESNVIYCGLSAKNTIDRTGQNDCLLINGIQAQSNANISMSQNERNYDNKFFGIDHELVNNEIKGDIYDSNLGSGSNDTFDVACVAGETYSSKIDAVNIRAGATGTNFDIIIDGTVYNVNTQLLGRHNIENILLAAEMAYALGVEAPYIIDAIENLQPVPHRMQLILGNGIRIIDDSFNSNPNGAECALDTLSMFEGRKVVLTPGLVELGEREYEENYELGKKMSVICDLAMLVGVKRTDPIKKGLLDGGFGGEIHIYDSLKDAENDFANRLKLDDVLLILNDLPDIYEEKKNKKTITK